jgi:hypothetical protein
MKIFIICFQTTIYRLGTKEIWPIPFLFSMPDVMYGLVLNEIGKKQIDIDNIQ